MIIGEVIYYVVTTAQRLTSRMHHNMFHNEWEEVDVLKPAGHNVVLIKSFPGILEEIPLCMLKNIKEQTRRAHFVKETADTIVARMCMEEIIIYKKEENPYGNRLSGVPGV